MQPKTHAFVIEAAVAGSATPWLNQHLSEILQGCQDEDVWLVGGLRLRAPGLTHSYKPGSDYGELFARSARSCLERCVERARESACDRTAARFLGRACHLLGDMAVPARTRGVWHLLGDPLEAFWESHDAERHDLLGNPPRLGEVSGDPGELADSLARASSVYSADTTRTPWGSLAYALVGRGQKLQGASVLAQARALLPLAVSHTRALLDSEASRRPSARAHALQRAQACKSL